MTFNRQRFTHPLPVPPVVDGIACVRCRREVARAATVIGEHGFRQCRNVAVCTATAARSTAVIGKTSLYDLAAMAQR